MGAFISKFLKLKVLSSQRSVCLKEHPKDVDPASRLSPGPADINDLSLITNHRRRMARSAFLRRRDYAFFQRSGVRVYLQAHTSTMFGMEGSCSEFKERTNGRVRA